MGLGEVGEAGKFSRSAWSRSMTVVTLSKLLERIRYKSGKKDLIQKASQ